MATFGGVDIDMNIPISTSTDMMSPSNVDQSPPLYPLAWKEFRRRKINLRRSDPGLDMSSSFIYTYPNALGSPDLSHSSDYIHSFSPITTPILSFRTVTVASPSARVHSRHNKHAYSNHYSSSSSSSSSNDFHVLSLSGIPHLSLNITQEVPCVGASAHSPTRHGMSSPLASSGSLTPTISPATPQFTQPNSSLSKLKSGETKHVDLIVNALKSLGQGTGGNIAEHIAVVLGTSASEYRSLHYTVNAILSSPKYRALFCKEQVLRDEKRSLWRLRKDGEVVDENGVVITQPSPTPPSPSLQAAVPAEGVSNESAESTPPPPSPLPARRGRPPLSSSSSLTSSADSTEAENEDDEHEAVTTRNSKRLRGLSSESPRQSLSSSFSAITGGSGREAQTEGVGRRRREDKASK
eukprot:TRINITY_DN8568_c0_g1_i1.p1 TRINITY_DN8568_c0_g1~~TRINITY_DN8568_c0_g1_i1.p1  ORF type:complete len:409 (-),score=103.91 TRINITY_DN8568_c0_g1_i1:4-1230(-)